MKVTRILPRPVTMPPVVVRLEVSEREAELLRILIGNTNVLRAADTINGSDDVRGTVVRATNGLECDALLNGLYRAFRSPGEQQL